MDAPPFPKGGWATFVSHLLQEKGEAEASPFLRSIEIYFDAPVISLYSASA